MTKEIRPDRVAIYIRWSTEDQSDNTTLVGRRKPIEHKQAEEVRFHGLRRARYHGLLLVTIQALLTAIAVNGKRMAALLCPLPARA
jgi:IS5 family transposase